jgi:hypothetical protein
MKSPDLESDRGHLLSEVGKTTGPDWGEGDRLDQESFGGRRMPIGTTSS